MTLEIAHIRIARDDVVGARRDRTGDDRIVIRIGCDHRLHFGRNDSPGKERVAANQLIGT